MYKMYKICSFVTALLLTWLTQLASSWQLLITYIHRFILTSDDYVTRHYSDRSFKLPPPPKPSDQKLSTLTNVCNKSMPYMQILSFIIKSAEINFEDNEELDMIQQQSSIFQYFLQKSNLPFVNLHQDNPILPKNRVQALLDFLLKHGKFQKFELN